MHFIWLYKCLSQNSRGTPSSLCHKYLSGVSSTRVSELIGRTFHRRWRFNPSWLSSCRESGDSVGRPPASCRKCAINRKCTLARFPTQRIHHSAASMHTLHATCLEPRWILEQRSSISSMVLLYAQRNPQLICFKAGCLGFTYLSNMTMTSFRSFGSFSISAGTGAFPASQGYSTTSLWVSSLDSCCTWSSFRVTKWDSTKQPNKEFISIHSRVLHKDCTDYTTIEDKNDPPLLNRKARHSESL